MSKPDNNTALREQIREIRKGDTGISTILPDFAIDYIVALFHEHSTARVVEELKQLRPPEQYADYAKIMGSEACTVCGFNSEIFRRYLDDRISELESNIKEESSLTKKADHE